MSGVSYPYRYQYQAVAASQTAQVLGGSSPRGGGDYLHRLVVNVTTTATSTIALLDGATSINLMSANTPVGTYSIEVNAVSQTGAWKLTTGAGLNVIAVGIFSA